MFGFLWWLVKAALKLTLAVVVISLAAFFYCKDDKAKVTFADGSVFSFTTSPNWYAADDSFPNFISAPVLKLAADAKTVELLSKQSLIFKGSNTLASSLTSVGNMSEVILVMANDYAYGRVCTNPASRGKRFTDIIAPAGNVFYCDMPDSSTASGYTAAFFYPVAANKFVAVIVDKQVWAKYSKEIYEILKTGTYTQH